jgi:hypothetical protein
LYIAKKPTEDKMTAFTETGSMINPQFLSQCDSNVRKHKPSLKSDVALVIFWAALVPGLMWLGAVSGF